MDDGEREAIRNDAKHLEHILWPNGLWDSERPVKYRFGAGRNVELDLKPAPGGFTWEAKWADGNPEVPNESFRTIDEAKVSLKKAIREKASELLYSVSEPAKSEMFV